MPKFREPGFPRDSEAAQTARSWSGNRKGGIRGCDAQLRWPKIDGEDLKEQDGSLPETNSKFAPEKMDGTGRRSGFLLGFGLFSGAFAVSFREGNPLEVEQFAPENISTDPQKERQTSSSPIHFFQELLLFNFRRVHKKNDVVISCFLFLKPSCGKWSNLTCAYFSDGLKPQPPTREDYNERCFWDLQFQVTTDLNGWCRYKLPRFLCKLGSKWFNLIPTLSKLLCWNSSRIPHKIWYFHSEILSSCSLLGGYLSNIAIFHFHDYGRKSIGNSCLVLCTPWLVHLFPLIYFAEIAGRLFRMRDLTHACSRKNLKKSLKEFWVVVSNIFSFIPIWGRFPFD